MEKIADYQRKTIFGAIEYQEKWPLDETTFSEGDTVEAGSVLGLKKGKLVWWKNAEEAATTSAATTVEDPITAPCILAGDVKFDPATPYVDVVVHGQVVNSQLIFGPACQTAEEKTKAIAKLREFGLYCKEE